VHAAIVSPVESGLRRRSPPQTRNAFRAAELARKLAQSGRTVAAVVYRQADRMTRDHDLEVRTDQ
jgi:hypothetical protein